jgi:hypothetical protein
VIISLMNLPRLLLTATAGLLLLAPSLARADLPPPDGTRYVPYRFRVDGSSKQSPDHVIVVYPWSLSNGAPTREQTTTPDGQWVSVGKRSYPPALYVVRKADYEAFVKTYAAADGPTDTDPKVDAFLAKSAKCNLAPNPDFTVSDDDPRSAIEEIFVAQTMSDTSCVLTKTNPPDAVGQAPKGGGCAGCTTSEHRIASGIGLGGLFALLVALGRKRSRR